jgi:hypothetical protein
MASLTDIDSSGNNIIDIERIESFITDASANITSLQNQLYKMQKPNNTDLNVNGNLIISNPINIRYFPRTINDSIGNQIGSQQVGKYIPFSKTTPINATSVYSIVLQAGVWLVESTICYTSDSGLINTEFVSLSNELDTNNIKVLLSTPIYSTYAVNRYQRISNVFRINNIQTIYASLQISDSDGSTTNITTIDYGNITATRIA